LINLIHKSLWYIPYTIYLRIPISFPNSLPWSLLSFLLVPPMSSPSPSSLSPHHHFNKLDLEGLRIRGKAVNKNVFAVVCAESIASHTAGTTRSVLGTKSSLWSWGSTRGTWRLRWSKWRERWKTLARRELRFQIFLEGWCLILACCFCVIGWGIGIVEEIRLWISPSEWWGHRRCRHNSSRPCGFRLRVENDYCSSLSTGVVTRIPICWNNKTTCANNVWYMMCSYRWGWLL